mmetsp:Transcript_28459/g.63533  ORF Transcript_28459/g.63533 Transcript_28459/m.63533 type:complete len:231 (+) Transcript_28459:303-995(+)
MFNRSCGIFRRSFLAGGGIPGITVIGRAVKRLENVLGGSRPEAPSPALHLDELGLGRPDEGRKPPRVGRLKGLGPVGAHARDLGKHRAKYSARGLEVRPFALFQGPYVGRRGRRAVFRLLGVEAALAELIEEVGEHAQGVLGARRQEDGDAVPHRGLEHGRVQGRRRQAPDFLRLAPLERSLGLDDVHEAGLGARDDALLVVAGARVQHPRLLLSVAARRGIWFRHDRCD